MDIYKFIKSGEEPFPDQSYGEGFRCSAYLKDGTFLPCVMIMKSEKYIDLACRRFDDERKGRSIFQNKKNGYREIVKSFVTGGNRVNDYDIASVEKSRFAIPLSLLKKIEGETVMSWTGFVFEMSDGKLFPFGTSFLVEFFDLPEGYSFEDVVNVHNHSYVNDSGEIDSIKRGMSDLNEDYNHSSVYREKPYFVCYVD